MRISDLYRHRTPAACLSDGTRRVVMSYELFPPRQPEPDSAIWAGIKRLTATRPDYVSVTFGAGGNAPNASREVVRYLIDHNIPTLAHLTCVERSRTQLHDLIATMLDDGVRNFLALRGDPPRGQSTWVTPDGGLNYASELVELIRDTASTHLDNPNEVDCAVAAYPAGSVQTRVQALDALAAKQAAGASFAITQVFFDPNDYRSMVDSASINGVNIPIIPGVMPFIDVKRLHRLETLTGVPVPPWLTALLNEPDTRRRIRAGMSATLDFIDELVEGGAPGIHLYTFNRTRPTLDVLEHLRVRGLHRGDPSSAHATSELLNEALHRVTPAS